jgi:hypothetical protein
MPIDYGDNDIKRLILSVTNTTVTANIGFLSGTQQDKTTIRLLVDGATYTIGGIVAGINGEIKIITCIGTGGIQLLDEDTAQTAANRIVTDNGNDYVLNNDGSVILQYNSTASRWIVITYLGSVYTSLLSGSYS